MRSVYRERFRSFGASVADVVRPLQNLVFIVMRRWYDNLRFPAAVLQ